MKNQPSAKINVLLVNEFEYYNDGMESAFKKFVCIGEIYCCKNGCEAIELIKEQKIDLIIMDADLRDMDGINTTKEITKTLKLDLKIIALFSRKEYFSFDAMIQAGAKGLLLKTTTSEEMEKAIEFVIYLKKKYHAKEIEVIITDFENSLKNGNKRKISFSNRQIEILKLSKSEPGLVRKEIARKLSIEKSTVDTLINRMFKKTNINKMAELVKLAEKLGLI